VLDSVRALRSQYTEQAFAGVDAEVLVGGETAATIDYIDTTSDYTPIVIGFVLLLSFVLLTIVFRSIVVPIKAIIMNLLSVGAAYGILVLVFQEGVGNELLGFQQVDIIEAWVPLWTFSILFGLSMDYHVFLLSRIRERFDRTGDNRESVAFGVRSTAGIITGAALIMAAVFMGFALGDLVMFQQMGFGLAVAVLLDATIVRAVLVPSTMTLLGKANWYLPSWLEWLPDLRERESREVAVAAANGQRQAPQRGAAGGAEAS
jgi:RND superfamily putative drug exporter